MTIGLVPYFEKVLLEFNPVVSAASVCSLALFVNFSGSTGLAVHDSFFSKILAYDVLWLLEDCPLQAYLPLHLAIVAMHVSVHLCSGAKLQLLSVLLGYLGLGVVLPVVLSGLLLPGISHAKVPGALHTALSATAMGVLLLDQLLRAPRLVEPIQDALAAAAAGAGAAAAGDESGAYGGAGGGGAGGGVLARALASLLGAPQPGSAYGYGLAESTGLGLMWSALVVLLVSSFVSVISEGDGGPLRGLASRTFLAAINKNSAASALLTLLRGLPTAKKYVVVAMLAISLLQGVGIVSIAAGLLVQGPESFVRTAPAVLLCVMAGVVAQVGGVLYVLVPSGDGAAVGADGGAAAAGGPSLGSMTATTAPATLAQSEMDTVSGSTSQGGVTTPGAGGERSLLTRANLAAQENMLGSFSGGGSGVMGAGNLETYSMMSGLSRGPSERLSSCLPEGMQDDGALDLHSRIEALANFKTFMQGLDQQPGVYSLEEFIRGAAAAMKGIFPGVAHASFCLLNSTRNCVNMYTFLGDGSRKPPRINVAVAPGTLIYHVLHNCQPVFISNVAAFPGPYADVQFMRFVLGLRSVACLPLVVAGSRVLGVLRLGFEEQWNWTEQEKSIAKQLALVLSSTSSGMGGGSLQAQPSGAGGMQPPMAPPNAAAAAAAAAAAGFPNVAAILAAGGAAGLGSGSAHAGMEDPLSPYGTSMQLQSLQHLQQHALQHQQQQAFDGTLAASTALALAGGMAGTPTGPVRRGPRHQGSKSSLQYASGPYASGPGSVAGSDSGATTATVAAAHSMLAAAASGRSDADFQAFYAAAVAGAGGGMPGQFGATAHAAQLAAAAGMGYPVGGLGGGGRAGGGLAGGGGGLTAGGSMGPGSMGPGSMRSGMSSGRHSGRPLSGSGSEFGMATGEIDETWLLQRPGSAQVRRALAGPAQAQGHGVSADIKMLEVIGRGGFGSVYKAFWRGMVVAVKVLEHEDEILACSDGSGSRSKLDTSSRRAALLEGAMTSTISHAHVVQTYDYRVVHLDPQSSLNGITRARVLHETHIIMEFCDRGSLQDAIEQGVFVVDGPRGARGGGNEPEVDMELIIMTLAEVSGAMEYLHKHRITHRDLKPKNILLRSSNKDRRGYVAKVSDFGLSQVLPDTNKTQVSTKYSGTVTHMAPELIEDGKVYQQGDVYAFGIIMWEVFTSATPYQNMAHPQIMVGVVTHNLRPKFPATCPEWYKGLAYRCWRKDPKARPPFSEVTKTLLSMLSDKEWKQVDPGS